MYYRKSFSSPAGMLTLASDGKMLTGLWLEGQKYFLQTVKNDTAVEGDLPVFAATEDWLRRYFAGEQPDPRELPLAPRGSDFQQMIWTLLLQIPYGKTATYGELARQAATQLGKASMSAQAVGGAVGHNPISIIIPCHRVLGANGSLTGYAGGLEHKRQLLRLEGISCD